MVQVQVVRYLYSQSMPLYSTLSQQPILLAHFVRSFKLVLQVVTRGNWWVARFRVCAANDPDDVVGVALREERDGVSVNSWWGRDYSMHRRFVLVVGPA